MNRKKRIETNQNHPQKSVKPKRLVILGRTTYIDEIIKKFESQASLAPRTTSIQSPNTLPRVVASPSAAHAMIHNETEGFEQSLQNAEHISNGPSREGASWNLQVGEGETSGEIQVEDLDPESAEKVVETETLGIPDRWSAIKPPPHSPSNPTKITPPEQEIPKSY